jgi:hypothetical protein
LNPDLTLEQLRFLEHKLRTLEFLITTSPGLTLQFRQQLLAVIAADSYVGIETQGDA